MSHARHTKVLSGHPSPKSRKKSVIFIPQICICKYKQQKALVQTFKNPSRSLRYLKRDEKNYHHFYSLKLNKPKKKTL